ncbi:DHA2 family efflux MFS transporter permease subunit [Methylobacterium sp. PvR107]|uniref:DHA2 family efflux MFS transporter permease subunit n=1 Tax=Methylobacterium sp. PvR107 TaxID=2806597 RepID=UPI001AEAB60E|nr:DHA2 family efflux MFS transporter permease subunit [Methylobacterium sp. PvR107]MBP1179827.1 EmrB/QacA subfamily drug resistance transporter [Methylobacterium sp. PvR107]
MDASPHDGSLKSRRREPIGHPRLTLATCILASSLAFVDGSVVNVGLPALGRDLGGGAAGLQWVINGYLLPLTALLLLGGALGDRIGRRRTLILGALLFAAASLACGLAPNLAILVAARLGQGVGAALLLPNSLAILSDTFTGEARGRAVGTWSAAGAATAAIGPVFGGWLIDGIGWRAMFLVNLPLAFGAAFLAWRYVAADRTADAGHLDIGGAILATFGLGTMTWGLIVGSGHPGFDWQALTLLGIGAALLVGFVLWERRQGDRAMMPLALFSTRSFAGLTLLTLLLYGALGAMLVLLPYILIEASGYSSTAAGAALLPLPLVIAVGSPVLGGLAGRIGSRPLLTAGPLVVAAGFLLLLRIGEHTAYVSTVLPGLVVAALGMACAVAPLTTAVLGSVDERHSGSASGFNSAVARAGGLVATSLIGGILAARGSALVDAFHGAVVATVMACVAASGGGLMLERRKG